MAYIQFLPEKIYPFFLLNLVIQPMVNAPTTLASPPSLNPERSGPWPGWGP